MQQLAPEDAVQIGHMIQMAPNALAKRMRCSAANARRAQQLMVLAIVRNARRFRGEATEQIDKAGFNLATKMNKSCGAQTLCAFANLLKKAEHY